MKEVIEEYQTLEKQLMQLTQLHSDCLSGKAKDFKLTLNCELPDKQKSQLQFDEDGSIITHKSSRVRAYNFFDPPDKLWNDKAKEENKPPKLKFSVSEILFVRLVEYLIQDYTQRLKSIKAKIREQLK